MSGISGSVNPSQKLNETFKNSGIGKPLEASPETVEKVKEFGHNIVDTIKDGLKTREGKALAVISLVLPSTLPVTLPIVAAAVLADSAIKSVKSNSPVTKEDLTWANDLQSKIKQGYNPTHHEEVKYTNIYNKTTQDTSPVTKADLSWANDLISKIEQGYKPTHHEEAKYNNIYNKMAQDNSIKTSTKANPPATKEELIWAKEFSKTMVVGKKLNHNDMGKYTNILEKNAANKADLTWSKEFSKTMVVGKKLDHNDMERYTNILEKNPVNK